jgi:putative ABC transport system permease protein
LITIFGFAVGLASAIIIFMYIKSELAHDKNWENSGNIYRVTQSLNMSGKDDPFALTSFPVAPALKEVIPGIETVVRFNMAGTQNIEVEDHIFTVEDVFAADPDFYRIFNYSFVSGQPENALSEPFTAILSVDEAIRFFGTTDAIGKTFKTVSGTFKVTGVFRNDDFVSHFVPSMLISTSSFPANFVDVLNADWFRMISYTYILAAPGTKMEDIKQSIDQWTAETIDPWINELELSASTSFQVEPLTGIHFNTSRQYDMPSNTSSKYIFIFGAIGIFILVIASINYMNLATAKSIRRAREIGIRKVSGATKSQLLIQFLGEAIIFSMFSLIISLILIELFTPVFNQITGKSLSLFHETAGMKLGFTWLQVLLIVVLVGLFSGSFPALVLSGFKPIHVLKGGSMKLHTGKVTFSAAGLRKGLVVLQFVISVAMLISTWVVFDQLQFMRTHDLGFEKNNIMVVNLPADTSLVDEKESFVKELRNYSGIEMVSATNNLPGFNHGRLLFFVDEDGTFINKTMNIFAVDENFDDILQLKIQDGRFFSKDYAHDDTAAFVVNQAAVKFLGLNDPIGHRMYCGLGVNGRIVGVVNDFHYASLQKEVEPLVMISTPHLLNRIAIKIQPKNLKETIAHVESKWQSFSQKHPMNFNFLDTNFDLQYDRERRLLSIFGYFAILIVIISSMGLLGLASYTIEQRTKEIGIRKVLGSTENQITHKFVKEFINLIILAGLLAIPLSYFLMTDWLDSFANRITLSWYYFAASLAIAVSIALLTVIFQSIKAARANPVDVLKYE